MGIKINIDGVNYLRCKECGGYHKTSKGKKNKKHVVCIEK